MADSIRVLLADDHAMFRAGLRALLETEGGIDVVGEAGSGNEAVERALELRPDVVLMDLSMPDTHGLDATRRIAALGIGVHVLVLTAHAEEEYLVPVVEAGASGYLTKARADRDLLEAIRTVARGEVYLPAQAATLLLREMRNSGGADQPGLSELSPREREVLALTAEGYSSSEIGKKLFISSKTVDTYRARIMEKLGLNHRSELVRFALKVGLLREL
ncbi:MAG: response regulator transcription factor [Gemmatimonadota bacterium]